MGIDKNSHGKKSDKETQSPLLKIFKEIMMREDNDPEKRNLLLDQEKKRKQYSGPKTKVNRRSCESSSSEHRKRSPYKTLVAEQRLTEIPRESQHDPCQVEDPGCKPEPIKNEDDTCSCVSCALRRIVGSEYACIACLLILFSISIVAAFCLVYKNVPTATATTHKKFIHTTVSSAEKKLDIGDSERLKRKIDMINDNLMKNELREEEAFGKSHYNDISADPMDSPGSPENEFVPSFSDLVSECFFLSVR
ncbi:unnamed protein product [Arctia plantaginis]|uniref:Uncharacterized protein n=1 Tax=Arctia plantaginis TaxID=874455 RepID=A0A8S1BQD0_ARCPL|nr:unnamed protein product [Arctia plantaginis]